MNWKDNPTAAFRLFLSALWWKPMLVLTAMCLVFQEQYPFSDFPMYSSFGPTTYYLYVADGSDAPVASMTTLGMSTPTMKKVFSTEMRKERERLQIKRLTPEQKRAVGERFLGTLKNSPAALQRGGQIPPVLRLYQVNISLADGRLGKERELIAEHR